MDRWERWEGALADFDADDLCDRCVGNSKVLFGSGANVAGLCAGSGVGAAVFNSGLWVCMRLARALSVSSSNPVRSAALGACGLAAASAGASFSFLFSSAYGAHALGSTDFPFNASLPPSLLERHLPRAALSAAQLSASSTSILWSWLPWASPARPPGPPRLAWADEQLLYAVAGALLFAAAGGRLRFLAPSDLRLPGAFASRRHALPAKLYEYATPAQRRQIQLLGKRFGCHHCGSRQTAGFFTADHIPPNKYSTRKLENVRWLWRTQRLYPQCNACSAKQAVSVKTDAAQLVLPRRLRLHNLWLPLPQLAYMLLMPMGI
jgi:hypothetical protein